MRTDFNTFLNIAPLGTNTMMIYLAVASWFFLLIGVFYILSNNIKINSILKYIVLYL